MIDAVDRDLMLAFQITERRSIEVGSAASAAEHGWVSFGVLKFNCNLKNKWPFVTEAGFGVIWCVF